MTDIHQRDWQHAYKFFTSGDFNFAPKVKFLYHVVFTLTEEARSFSTLGPYDDELSVLVKESDLPGYSAQVEVKQQYNRKKNVQTRIDYDPVQITFHDDNVGVTSRLLEEYYKYYFVDGNKINGESKIDFGARDKYSLTPSNYGLNNKKTGPFFSEIRIYQFSRQEWNAYTLINPLVERWRHGDVSYSEGAGIVDNSMTVMYEGVLYTRGDVDPGSDPSTFGRTNTYDLTPSPFVTNNEIGNVPISANRISLGDAIVRSTEVNLNSNSTLGSSNLDGSPTGSTLSGTNIPPRDPAVTSVSADDNSVPNLPADNILIEMNNNSDIEDSVVRFALGTGAYSDDWDSNNFGEFDDLPQEEQDAITNEIKDRIAAGDPKLTQIGSQVVANPDTTRVTVSTSGPLTREQAQARRDEIAAQGPRTPGRDGERRHQRRLDQLDRYIASLD